ncbi:MAG: hypothetical protein AB1568_04605 [Thermodesulfobacteriota bacterium]
MPANGRTVEQYLNTSVDDCDVSIRFIPDVNFLRRLLAECERLGHKTRAVVVRRQIRRLEKELR